MKISSFTVGLLSTLFTGVVEAGDLDVKTRGSMHIVSKENYCMKYIKDFGDTIVTCNDKLTACFTPCELKMRAIMKVMDEYLDQRGDFIFPLDLEKSYARREAVVRLFNKWHSVMKECIR